MYLVDDDPLYQIAETDNLTDEILDEDIVEMKKGPDGYLKIKLKEMTANQTIEYLVHLLWDTWGRISVEWNEVYIRSCLNTKTKDLKLKNLKVHNDMSQETVCFSASIYWKGKKAGVARNEGREGATSMISTWINQLKNLKNGLIRNTLPTQVLMARKREVTTEKFDWIVDELRQKQKPNGSSVKIKKQVIFRIEGDEGDLTEQLAIKGNLKGSCLGPRKIR